LPDGEYRRHPDLLFCPFHHKQLEHLKFKRPSGIDLKAEFVRNSEEKGELGTVTFTRLKDLAGP
jgi:hypothetical protein